MRKFLLALAFLTLCGLGVWQLQRLEWKEQLLARIAAAQTMPPLDLGLGKNPQPFRRVTVTGTFDHEHELYFPAKVKAGKVGKWVITPLVTPEHTYIVNRGWTETTLPQPEGAVTITGLARMPEPPHWLQPPNDLVRNQWYGFDLPAMGTATGHENVAPFYILAGDNLLPEIPNNHLQYALTWFALAAILLIMALRRPTPFNPP